MAIVQLFDRVAAAKAIMTWAATISGLPAASIVWANQNIEMPTRPYIVLNVPSDVPQPGFAERTYSYDPAGLGQLTELVSAPFDMTLSINIYTDKTTNVDWETTREAMDVARDMRGAEQLTSARLLLSAAGVVLREMTGATDLSELDGDRMVSRAQFDALMSYSSNISDAFTAGTGWITSMELTETVEAETAITDIITITGA